MCCIIHFPPAGGNVVIHTSGNHVQFFGDPLLWLAGTLSDECEREQSAQVYTFHLVTRPEVRKETSSDVNTVCVLRKRHVRFCHDFFFFFLHDKLHEWDVHILDIP